MIQKKNEKKNVDESLFVFVILFKLLIMKETLMLVGKDLRIQKISFSR